MRHFTYLARGQVSDDKRDTSDDYAFAANDNGRNASAAVPAIPPAPTSTTPSSSACRRRPDRLQTQFVFDRFGHLLEEANSSGAAQKEYIWAGDMPVAVIDDTGASPVLYYIHTDQSGSPQKITNAAGTIVWDGVFDPFGNAQFVSGGGVWDTSQWDNFLWGGSLG